MKRIIAFLLFICSIISFSSCYVTGALFGGYAPPYDDPSVYPEYPVYQSAYTEEEHIERISEIVASEEWGGWLSFGRKLRAYEVETVYAFCDNDPEFFLVDLQFENTCEALTVTGERVETDEGFMLGYIVHDEYYILGKKEGKNPWQYAGYDNEKKYFGSFYFAVEIGGAMTAVAYDTSIDWPNDAYVYVQNKEMSQAEQTAAMDYKYNKTTFKRNTEYDDYATFRCEYSEHENLNRLSLFTENGAWKNEEYIPLSLGDLVDFEVETVYAFYDYTPQFFLIDLTFENTVELTSAQGVTETTNQAYILGRIDERGNYYTLMIGNGRNPWEYAEYKYHKKYWGQYHYAVETGGEMKAFLYQSRFSVKPKFMDKVLTVEEEKDFLECKYSSETIGEYKAPKTE